MEVKRNFKCLPFKIKKYHVWHILNCPMLSGEQLKCKLTRTLHLTKINRIAWALQTLVFFTLPQADARPNYLPEVDSFYIPAQV